MKKPTIILISLSPVILLIIIFFIVKKIGNNNKVVARASRYIGQLELTKGSYEQGFQNKVFHKRMQAVGWQKGFDWCAIFVKLIFFESYKGEKLDVLKQLMTASTQGTFKNFKDNEKKYSWYYLSKKPKRGAIAVYQSVRKPAFGHFAIVKNANKNGFTSIEGNVPAKDGYDGVIERERSFNDFKNKKGNKLICFINFK